LDRKNGRKRRVSKRKECERRERRGPIWRNLNRADVKTQDQRREREREREREMSGQGKDEREEEGKEKRKTMKQEDAQQYESI
jgi:hypothetical protein